MESGKVSTEAFKKLCRDQREGTFASGGPAVAAGRNSNRQPLCRYVVTDDQGNPAPEEPDEWALRPCGCAWVTELCYHLGAEDKLKGCHLPMNAPPQQIYEVGRGTFALPGEIITGFKDNGRIETVGQHGLVRKATVMEETGDDSVKYADVSGVRIDVEGIEDCEVNSQIQICFEPNFEDYENKEECGTWLKVNQDAQACPCGFPPNSIHCGLVLSTSLSSNTAEISVQASDGGEPPEPVIVKIKGGGEPKVGQSAVWMLTDDCEKVMYCCESANTCCDCEMNQIFLCEDRLEVANHSSITEENGDSSTIIHTFELRCRSDGELSSAGPITVEFPCDEEMCSSTFGTWEGDCHDLSGNTINFGNHDGCCIEQCDPDLPLNYNDDFTDLSGWDANNVVAQGNTAVFSDNGTLSHPAFVVGYNANVIPGQEQGVCQKVTVDSWDSPTSLTMTLNIEGSAGLVFDWSIRHFGVGNQVWLASSGNIQIGGAPANPGDTIELCVESGEVIFKVNGVEIGRSAVQPGMLGGCRGARAFIRGRDGLVISDFSLEVYNL